MEENNNITPTHPLKEFETLLVGLGNIEYELVKGWSEADAPLTDSEQTHRIPLNPFIIMERSSVKTKHPKPTKPVLTKTMFSFSVLVHEPASFTLTPNPFLRLSLRSIQEMRPTISLFGFDLAEQERETFYL
ncbi:MAG: hypothetical protein PF442_01505 [Desulfobulbaceae bacterium]|nr:hypothetical protein [Desulfobulbaceae bacterium]